MMTLINVYKEFLLLLVESYWMWENQMSIQAYIYE